MKLELKHIAPYLPYELKCYGIGESDETDDEKPQLFQIEGMNSTWVEVSGRLETVTDEIHIEDCIPHLLPLSALTEPMEDGSVPIDFLIEKYYAHPIEKIFNQILNDNQNLVYHLEYYLIEHLLEWHFDVYGLIDAGLAIDKRTIK